MGTNDDNIRLYNQDDISEFSMDIQQKFFFNKLQEKLYNILNEFLIKEEKNGKKEYKTKIQRIMKIISELDIIKPKINKINDCIWEEKNKNYENPLIHQKKWFELYKKITIKYVIQKGENDTKKYSNEEYLNIEIKYIKEEIERQNNYINKIFHDELNNIFFLHLIKDYMINQEEDKNLFEMEKMNELKMLYEILNIISPSSSDEENIIKDNNQISFKKSKTESEGLKILKIQFKEYIKKNYSSVINNKNLYNYGENSKKIIKESINIKKKFDEFIYFCFNNDNDFIKIKDQEIILLVKAYRFNHSYFSKYVDFCMKHEFINKTQDEIEEIIDEIIFMIKNSNQINIIRKELNKYLFCRLINDSFISIKLEDIFISKFTHSFINSPQSKEIINIFRESEKVIEDYKKIRLIKESLQE